MSLNAKETCSSVNQLLFKFYQSKKNFISRVLFSESSSIVPRSLLIRLLTPARRTAMPSTSGSAARPRFPVFRLDNTIYGIYRRWWSHCIRLDENCRALRLSFGNVFARGTSIFAYEGADRVSPSTCCC